ncbi:MAG: hypothetical protein PVG13_03950 [Thiohalophilus sp.]|jgi:hypothetical protein
MDSIDSLSLCQSDQLLSVAGRDDCHQVVDLMSRQAQHSLYMFSNDLDPELYDNSGFVDSVRRIVANDPNAVVRVLFYSVDKLIHRGHRLVDLARRLPSYVEIRQLTRAYNHAFFVADECGIVDRRVADRYAGTANFNDPGRAAQLVAFFNNTWDISSQNMELHALQL